MSPQPPRVSVVIPAFNAAAFIESTLDSVAAQTYKSFEVIVVDDGSSDGTTAAAEALLKRKRVPGRVLAQANKKIAAARNAGMAAARGGYVALLDHDDSWFPKKLERVMEEFERHPEAGLVGHREHVVRDGVLLRATPRGPEARNMYERLLLGGNALSPSASVFRRDLALSIGGFRENPEFDTVEDYDFWMRLSRATVFRFISDILGRSRVAESGASRRTLYHHANLESLLKDHFRSHFGENPTRIEELKMRRRLSAARRSALAALMEAGAPRREQARAMARMLRAYPLAPKNLARAVQCLGRILRPW